MLSEFSFIYFFSCANNNNGPKRHTHAESNVVKYQFFLFFQMASEIALLLILLLVSFINSPIWYFLKLWLVLLCYFLWNKYKWCLFVGGKIKISLHDFKDRSICVCIKINKKWSLALFEFIVLQSLKWDEKQSIYIYIYIYIFKSITYFFVLYMIISKQNTRFSVLN